MFVLLLAVSANAVKANVPDTVGRVIYKDTGEGVHGILVKWKDRDGGVRYTRTDASGRYVFQSFTTLGDRTDRAYQSTELVDTNYDGVNDTPLWKVDQLYGENNLARGFGCGQNPQTYTVLQRPDMIGYFENGEQVNNNVEISNGSNTNVLRDFVFVRTAPECPTDIRKDVCNASNKTAKVVWNAPSTGADGYEVFFDKAPFGDNNTATDKQHPNTSNQLAREIGIDLNADYRVQVRSVKQMNGQTQKSAACSADFICTAENTPVVTPCPPGTDNCPGTGGGNKNPLEPTAQLTGNLCPIKSNGFYYDYTISNINTQGIPFFNSKMMVVFSYSTQNNKILTFLNSGTQFGVDIIADHVGFSKWQEQARGKVQGDYFGFYVANYDSLPISTFRLTDSTRIGTKSIGELRTFLAQNNLPTTFDFKANMKTRLPSGEIIFNTHIPANNKINLSPAADVFCSGSCPVIPGGQPACVLDINITSPGNVAIVPNAQNQITVTWTSAAPAGSNFETILYDKAVYPNATAAYTAYASNQAKAKSVLYFQTTGKSQIFDLDFITGTNLSVAVRGESATGCNISDTTPTCNWRAEAEKKVDVGFPVGGKFYISDGSTCQAIPANEVALTGSVSVANKSGINPGTFINSKLFSMNLPPSDLPYTLQLNLQGVSAEQFTCAGVCGQGNQCVRTDITEDKPQANFFVKPNDTFTNSWWQVFGGQTFAESTINSELPNSDTNGRPWRLVERLVTNIAESAGIPFTNRSAFGNNVAGWLSNREPQLQATSAKINLSVKPNYGYFKDKVGIATSYPQLPSEIRQASDLNGQLKDGVFVHYREGDLKFAPSQSWNVSGNQHHIVLVNGSITLSSENLSSGDTLVSTQVGSTTVFVASGNIIFSGNVGNSDLSSLSPNVSGIFIADQIVIQGGTDKRFVGAGSYFGWKNVALQRQFSNDSLNETTPSETFIYRPDFVIYLPESLRDSSLTWREVN